MLRNPDKRNVEFIDTEVAFALIGLNKAIEHCAFCLSKDELAKSGMLTGMATASKILGEILEAQVGEVSGEHVESFKEKLLEQEKANGR